MRSIGKIGKDIHKINKPDVPESVGIGFMIIYLIVMLFGALNAPDEISSLRLAIMCVVLFGVTAMGLYDDFKTLSAIAKPGLLILLSIPVFFFRSYNDIEVISPSPTLPFIGETRLSIVYWGLAIFVVAIPSNASNMLDVLNGAMSGSGILIGITAFLASFILPLSDSAIFVTRYSSVALVALLIGFWWFNRYPASVFAGDTGSLGVGAAIGLIALYGEMEFVLVVALLVHIMNSFSIIGSIGGLKERRQIRHRPVKVENGLISASSNENAPITLVRLLVARKSLDEKSIVLRIHLLVLFTCILGIITAYFMRFDVL